MVLRNAQGCPSPLGSLPFGGARGGLWGLTHECLTSTCSFGVTQVALGVGEVFAGNIADRGGLADQVIELATLLGGVGVAEPVPTPPA